ncbi:MAG TPA: polymer-forming cytoskeletal protein [Caulobacteraceae bacterium]|nr:polymer-forming cytoskeletal protein [Caulobacteraceae bacterium]
MTGTTASFIAAGTRINGGVTGDCPLQVDGVVHGDVEVPYLSVGQSGKVEGASKAESVEVRGRVLGSISAKQVTLLTGCNVEGDISHEQLIIEPGAVFEGRSLRLGQPAPALVFRARSEATA